MTSGTISGPGLTALVRVRHDHRVHIVTTPAGFTGDPVQVWRSRAQRDAWYPIPSATFNGAVAQDFFIDNPLGGLDFDYALFAPAVSGGTIAFELTEINVPNRFEPMSRQMVEELIAEGAGADLSAHLADAVDAHDASAISVVDTNDRFIPAVDTVEEALDAAMWRAAGEAGAGGTVTLLARDSGKTFYLTGGDAYELPAPGGGVRFRFVGQSGLVGNATISANVSGSEFAGYVFDIQAGGTLGPGAGDDLITIDDATITEGDYIEVEGNGAGWIVTGVVSLTAAVTFS